MTVGLATCVVVWFLRRPDQLLHPYLWAEEYLVLNRFQEAGFWQSSFHPYVGYFLLPTSFSLSATAAITIADLPTVAYWMSTLWFIGTILLILAPGSEVPIGYRVGIALAVTAAPATPEVYGALLYSFWWTSLWPLIPVLWRKQHTAAQVVVSLIGGLSSLAGAVLALPMALTYLLYRRRCDLAGSLTLFVCLGVQVVSFLRSPRAAVTPDPGAVAIQSLRNFSFFALNWAAPSSVTLAAAGVTIMAVLALIAVRAARAAEPTSRAVVATASALLLVGVVSSVPVPLISDPVLTGPRYYFLPFALLGWLLVVALAARLGLWVRLAAIVLLVLGAASLTRAFARQSDRVDWATQLRPCATAVEPFFVPVHSSGRQEDMWVNGLRITPETCRRVLP